MSNPYGALLLLLLVGLTGGLAVAAWLRRRRAVRRHELRSRPLSAGQQQLLRSHTRWYVCLTPAERTRLAGRINEFLADKQFIGCNGFELTDEVRLLTAAHAGLLLINRDDPTYPQVRSILVYPDSFVAEYREEEDWLVHELAEVRAGEAWDGGPLILAWEEVLDGARHGDHNVILHEFAHKLDDANPAGDGLPLLDDAGLQARWSQIMAREYAALRAAAERGEATLIDPYGAESPAEFFAVLTECFFLQGAALREAHPALYALLADYFAQDPAGWPAGAATSP